MTLPDPLVRGWIDSLVERAGAHLRAELGALATQMQVEMRLRDVELGSEPERRGSSATLPDERTAARLDERQPDFGIVSVLLQATTALDQATSLSAVLDVLVHAAAAHASRVLLVVRRGDVLAGWRSAGPAAHGALDTAAIQMSLTDNGLVATAARSGQTQVGAGPAAGTGTPGPHESPAVAVPLLVGGRVAAVLFAHEASGPGEHALPSAWPEVIEALARHAARCLEVLTVQRLPRLVQAKQVAGSSPDDRPSDA